MVSKDSSGGCSELPGIARDYQSTRPQILSSRPRSGAFTVIELLVVLAVIALLGAIVLPAVQQAREAARLVRCKNNLHQIGVALHSYQAATGTLPPGWIMETPVGSDSQNGWGWLAMCLPQVEQAQLFNSINFGQHVGSSSNLTSRLTMLEVFMCPSEHVPARVPFYLDTNATTSIASMLNSTTNPVLFEVAGASYAGVFGPADPHGDLSNAVGPGAFFANSRTRAADFVDGLSLTLIVGERSARHLATTWTGMHQLDEEGPERVVGFADGTPNAPDADEAGFSSRHPGGAHFLLGDGSVRFLGDHVEGGLYKALSTRAGQENVGHSEF
jgi:prepilin-type processing-associated H-X9-DG protein